MKHKLDPLTALAKIKLRVGSYYEALGKLHGYELDGSEVEDLKKECLEDIDTILSNVEIPAKYLITAKMEGEEENG